MAEITGFTPPKMVPVPATYEVELTEEECYHLMLDLLDVGEKKDFRPGTQRVYAVLSNRKVDPNGGMRNGF